MCRQSFINQTLFYKVPVLVVVPSALLLFCSWGMVLFIIKDLLVLFLEGLQGEGCVFICCAGHCSFAYAENEKKQHNFNRMYLYYFNFNILLIKNWFLYSLKKLRYVY